MTVNKWIGNLNANLRKVDEWKDFLSGGASTEWRAKKVPDRGFSDANKADALKVDAILEYIAQFAPGCLYRDITSRATSIKQVFEIVREWAGLQSFGSCHQTYYQTKRSFKNDPESSPVDFYYELRNAKEDCLLRSATHGGTVKYKGKISDTNEDFSPTMESDVVADWLETIGGPALLEHVFRTFSKDLQSESLADIRQRITDNLDNLKTESSHAELSKVNVYSFPCLFLELFYCVNFKVKLFSKKSF